MSFVEHIDPEAKNARFHEAAYTTYSVTRSDGETRVQLQSYGSADRAKQGGVSQVLQFDKASAKELIKIFDREFSLHLNFE